MRTKLRYAASALLSFLLCAVMLCGAVLSTMADGAELPSLDYTNPAVESRERFSAYDLYTALLDRTPTAGETLYWQAHELSLSYSSFIPDSCIDTDYNGEEGVLNITVSPYSYTAVNGVVVTWVPESFNLEGKKYDLREQDGVYAAQIDNCFYSGDFAMQVEYGCQIEIEQSVIQVLSNEAYQKGYSALEEMNEYEKQLADYNKRLEAHNAYNAYIKWEEDYANYLVEKAIYDKLKETYDAYMVEYNAYQTVLDAYNQWQNYFAQEKAYAANEIAYGEYAKYYKDYKAAVDKLAMFEAIFKRDSNGWCMYNDIMGESVTKVLSMQDVLIGKGGDKEGVNSAGVATENLRVLLKGYNDLRTQKWSSNHAKYQALYQYYSDNYDALKENFISLYENLYGMYSDKIVSTAIASLGKSAHYRQLVGHLFVVSTAFDQNSNRNEDVWRIDKKKLRDVVEDVHYFPDGDWDPRNTPFPAVEVPAVERLEKPVRPTVEQPTVPPDAPPVVENPGEAPICPPTKPYAPKPEEEVGKEPARPVFDAAIEALYQEVKNGTLKEDSTPAQAAILKLNRTVDRNISIQNLKTVTFYNLDGSIYKQVSVHYGEKVEWEYLNLEASAEYTYEFLGWKYADGSVVKDKWVTVTENTSLYLHYRPTKRMYTVTWIVDGKSYSQSLYYGSRPVPELVVNIAPSESQYYRYEFSGWHNSNNEPVEVTPVTGNVTYIGSMLQIPKKFNVTWVIKNGEERITEQWEYNQKPVFEGDLSISSSTHIYEFLMWDKAISPVTRDVTYTAKYRATPLATDGSNTAFEVQSSETEITVLATAPSASVKQAALLAAKEGKTLTVRWNDALSVSLNGEKLQAYINMGSPALIMHENKDGNATIYELEYFIVGANAAALPEATVTFAYSKANGIETVFDLQTENGWERTEGAQITVAGNFKARRLYAYSIVPTANEHCNVTQMIRQAVDGEWVSIALECIYGYKVVGATIVTAEGETVTVSGTSFQMPASPITVSLQVEEIVYRVTFKVDGEVWSYAEYHTGDEIVLPEDPTKAAEGEYVYTFIGWGDVPALATGAIEDLVFEASFAQSQTVNDYNTGNRKSLLVTLVLPVVIVIVVLVVGLLILRRIVRRKGGWRVVKVKVACGIRNFFQKVKKALHKLSQKKKDKTKDQKKDPEKDQAKDKTKK